MGLVLFGIPLIAMGVFGLASPDLYYQCFRRPAQVLRGLPLYEETSTRAHATAWLLLGALILLG